MKVIKLTDTYGTKVFVSPGELFEAICFDEDFLMYGLNLKQILEIIRLYQSLGGKQDVTKDSVDELIDVFIINKKQARKPPNGIAPLNILMERINNLEKAMINAHYKMAIKPK